MNKIFFLITMMIVNTPATATYVVSDDINSIELKLAIKHLEELNQEQTLLKHAGEINRWSETIELTNLELIIKTEFYKSFLNDSPQIEGVKLTLLNPDQLKAVESKLQTKEMGEFNIWFITNLLEEYPSSTSNQKKYISPWLMRFLELSSASWNKLINESIINYFNNLAAHLQIIQKYARTDRTASPKLGRKTLIDWQQNIQEKEEVPVSKSEAIDLIDKNLPKAP